MSEGVDRNPIGWYDVKAKEEKERQHIWLKEWAGHSLLGEMTYFLFFTKQIALSDYSINPRNYENIR